MYLVIKVVLPEVINPIHIISIPIYDILMSK